MASHNLQMMIYALGPLLYYNSRGYGPNKLEYILSLMSKCDILFLQEHWYFDNEINSIESSVGNIQVFGISDMDNDEILICSPYGGCAILINNSIKCKFDPIQLNKRSCGGILTIGSIAILYSVYICHVIQHTT